MCHCERLSGVCIAQVQARENVLGHADYTGSHPTVRARSYKIGNRSSFNDLDHEVGIDDLDHEVGIDDLDHEVGIDDLDHEVGINDLDHEVEIDDLHHEVGIDDLDHEVGIDDLDHDLSDDLCNVLHDGAPQQRNWSASLVQFCFCDLPRQAGFRTGL